MEAAQMAPDDEMRAQHDVIALLAAILSGEVELIQEMAKLSVSAKSSKGKQFYEAWAGVIKARVLKKGDEEMRQLAVFKKNKGPGFWAEPSNSAIEAFCFRDYASFNRELARAIQTTHREAQEIGALETSGSGDGQLFLARGNTVFRFRWPWPEAAFAKLAIFEGASFDFDTFWVPKDFMASHGVSNGTVRDRSRMKVRDEKHTSL